jgi:4-azaleucine resistance transporter AzlC
MEKKLLVGGCKVEAYDELTYEENDFLAGVKAGISIAIGYLPIALTFGLLAKGTGLTFIETVSMSVFVFAGASQYISLSLLSAGISGLEIVFTTFIVNIRHILMGMTINEKAIDRNPFTKLIYAFGITDETFTVASTKRDKIKAPFMFGLILMAYGSWVVNTGLGHLVGASLPNALQQSMSIALYAMFIGLLIPAAKKHIKFLTLAIVAGLLNSLLSIYISNGWAIVISTVSAAIIIESLWKGNEIND